VALSLLLLLYLGVALAHAVLAPLTTGPDELAHYEYIRFIADHGRLPADGQERGQASYKSDQPPLYHLVAALPTALVDPNGPPFLKRVSDHPRRQLIERTRHAWGLYNTEDEQWPYQGEVLRWHVGRWVAIFFGAATVVVTYFVARDLFARLPAGQRRAELLALGAAAGLAFIPRFALTGSMLNYETTLAFFATLYLGMVLRMAATSSQEVQARSSGSSASPFISAGLLGLFMGLAIATKLSALILPLETVGALWLIKRYAGWSWARWLRTLIVTGLAALIAVSWWFGFILYRFNTIAQDGPWVGMLRPLIAADSSDATTNRLLSFLSGGQAGFTGAIDNLDSGPPWEWLATLFRTYWVVGIEGEQPLGLLGLGLILAMGLLAAYGLGRAWRGSDSSVPASEVPVAGSYARLGLSLLLLHLAAAFVLPLIRYATTFSLADTAQGRHILFLAGPALAMLLVEGLSRAFSRFSLPALRWSSLWPGLFLLFWSGVQLWTMSWAYLPPLPVSTRPEAKTQAAAHRLNRPLNQYLTLVGYRQQQEARMLRLDLIWQAAAVSPVDFLTEVSLLDQENEIVSQWVGYPAEGRYPTRAWDAGDIVRDTVWLPLRGLEPGDYRLQLNLLANTVFPPPPPVATQLDPPLTLATVSLAESPAENVTTDLQIWQQGQPLGSPQTFRYRETILVTLHPVLTRSEEPVVITGVDPNLVFEPVRDLGDTLLFQVGPDWSTGSYQVQFVSGQFASESLVEVIDRWQRRFKPPEIARPVEANFANQIKLLGYELGANRVEPGDGIPLILYWQGLDWMGSDYTIFVKLLAADQTVHGGRDRLPREGYRTLYWAPGEIVIDPFGVPVDVDAPAGIYTINVGLYEQVDEQAVSLPLVEDGQLLDVTSLSLGPVKIGRTRPGWTLDEAEPEISLNQPFGQLPNLTLLGYDLASQPNPQSTRQEVALTLYWQSESPLAIDYTTFVHVRNEAGETVAQRDQPPLNGAYPSSLWDPGEIIADNITLTLPSDLPPGAYRLVVGLYDFETGVRLAVPGQPDNELTLTTLELGL
jgi:hypothetical protein